MTGHFSPSFWHWPQKNLKILLFLHFVLSFSHQVMLVTGLLSSTISQCLLKFMFFELVIFNYLIPVALLDTFQLGGLIFWSHIFLPFHTIHEILMARVRSGLPFPPPVDHNLSECFTMTHPSWVALNGMANSIIELWKPLGHDKAVIHIYTCIYNIYTYGCLYNDIHKCVYIDRYIYIYIHYRPLYSL